MLFHKTLEYIVLENAHALIFTHTHAEYYMCMYMYSYTYA